MFKKIGGRARAMVVTSSIERAIDFYQHISRSLEEQLHNLSQLKDQLLRKLDQSERELMQMKALNDELAANNDQQEQQLR